MTRVVFRGSAIFDGSVLHRGAALVVERGRVEALLPEEGLPRDVETVTLPGGTLLPGFVDLQVNGADGIFASDVPDVAGIRRICAAHARLGATGVLPTLITDRPEVTTAVLAAGAAAEGVPGFLGLHLEGPHIDRRRPGAHDPALIRPMTDADLRALLQAATRLPALMVTLAPEGATRDQIAALAAAGVVVSLGHSDATAAETEAGFDAGARAVTHLFNAMRPLGHREPGVVGAALDRPVHASLIADGIHVAPAALRIALAAKRGEDRLFLVTDAMAVAGTGQDRCTLGGREILRRDGRLTLPDGVLAGADVDMAASIRLLRRETDLPLEALLKMATSTPADLIGAPAGRLLPGRAADLVHLDDAGALAGVWRAGKPV